MKLSLNNFIYGVRQLVMGGGVDTDGSPRSDSGYLHDVLYPLSALASAAAITDSTTGTPGTALAAGSGVQTIEFSHTFIGGTSAVEPVTNYTPGFNFKILKWAAVTDVLLVGSGGSRVANMEIGTVDVGTVPSTVTIVEANATVGTVTAGTTVTGANTGTLTDTISIEIANGGTQFTAGKVNFLITIQNMDTANSLATLAAVGLNASETNLLVQSFPAGTTSVGSISVVIPRDYDEATDTFVIRMGVASAGATDTPGISAVAYRKRPGGASTQVGGTVTGKLAGVTTAAALSSAEQVLEFSFSRNTLLRDDAVTVVFTSDAHTTDVILVYFVEPVYRSTLVSYNETDGSRPALGNNLR